MALEGFAVIFEGNEAATCNKYYAGPETTQLLKYGRVCCSMGDKRS